VVGALLGMLLIGASVYADFESMLFDVSIAADGDIRPIVCPILMSSKEIKEVRAVVKNTTDYPMNSLVRTHVSMGHLTLMREIEQRVQLAPNEKQRLSWLVSAEDAAFGHLILVKVIMLKSGDPSHKGSCGIIVLNLPSNLKGFHLYFGLLFVSLVALLGGFRMWWNHGRYYTGRRLEVTRSMVGFTIIVVGGLAFSLVGLWEISAVFFYIGVLMVGVVVPHFLIAR